MAEGVGGNAMTEKVSPNLSTAIETALGRFIANFSVLESWLRNTLSLILFVDSPGEEFVVSNAADTRRLRPNLFRGPR